MKRAGSQVRAGGTFVAVVKALALASSIASWSAAEPVSPPKAAPSEGMLLVRVPENAAVYVNGHLTKSEGAWRRFVASGFKPGGLELFEVRVVTSLGGQSIEAKKNAVVSAGEIAYLFFGPAAAGTTDGRVAVGDQVRVVRDGAKLKIGDESYGAVAIGRYLPVLLARDGWFYTRVEQNGQQIKGWIPATWVVPSPPAPLLVQVRRPVGPPAKPLPATAKQDTKAAPKPAPPAVAQPTPAVKPPVAANIQKPTVQPPVVAEPEKPVATPQPIVKLEPTKKAVAESPKTTEPLDRAPARRWELPDAPSAEDLARLEEFESAKPPELIFDKPAAKKSSPK